LLRTKSALHARCRTATRKLSIPQSCLKFFNPLRRSGAASLTPNSK
jgi:hypothetical protein